MSVVHNIMLCLVQGLPINWRLFKILQIIKPLTFTSKQMSHANIPKTVTCDTHLQCQQTAVLFTASHCHSLHVVVAYVNMHLQLFTVQQQRKPLTVIGR